MRLPYLPLRGILKPIVEVNVLGPRPAIVRSLVDSGADFSLFDASVATYAGIVLDSQLQRTATGIGGRITAGGAWVDAIVAGRRLRLLIYFAPDIPVNLLGRDNFFHYSHICFDERKHELDLRYRRQ
ncbi:MAG: retropepsin-like domain-containing protein [Chloroflexi bacterium]|nr:retropepsin-like domain-containing protein [Chloroflexota bacterium]